LPILLQILDDGGILRPEDAGKGAHDDRAMRGDKFLPSGGVQPHASLDQVVRTRSPSVVTQPPPNSTQRGRAPRCRAWPVLAPGREGSASPVGDDAVRRIVGRNAHLHPVTEDDPDEVLTHLAADPRLELRAAVELDREEATGADVGDRAFHFDEIVASQKLPPLSSVRNPPNPRSVAPTGVENARIDEKLQASRSVGGGYGRLAINDPGRSERVDAAQKIAEVGVVLGRDPPRRELEFPMDDEPATLLRDPQPKQPETAFQFLGRRYLQDLRAVGEHDLHRRQLPAGGREDEVVVAPPQRR